MHPDSTRLNDTCGTLNHHVHQFENGQNMFNHFLYLNSPMIMLMIMFTMMAIA